MIINDERTKEEKISHPVLVTATDRFMSGWGGAKGGASKCAWACRREDASAVLAWVENRDEMKYVNVHYNGWSPRNAAHVSYYVVGEDHPALEGRLVS